MKKLICKTCGGDRSVGRRECELCHKASANQRAKKRYLAGLRTIYHHICEACGNSYSTLAKKSGRICKGCRDDGQERTSYTYSKIAKGRLVWEHRVVAERVLSRRLERHEIVHHKDGNGGNNSLENLMLMNRSNHAKLHRFLTVELIIWDKKNKWADPGDSRLIFICKRTEEWLKDTGERCLTLSEVHSAEI